MGRKFRATINLGHTVVKDKAVYEFDDDHDPGDIEQCMTEAAQDLMYDLCSDRYYEEVTGERDCETTHDLREARETEETIQEDPVVGT